MWQRISVLMTILALAANVGMQFYFKWVPDTKDQKRHVKSALTWLLNITFFALFGVDLYLLSRHKGPVDAGFVLRAVMLASLAVFYLIALIALRFTNLLFPLHRLSGDLYHDLVGLDKSLIGMIKDLVMAMELLARDPNLSKETTRALHVLLYGDRESTPQLESRREDKPR